MVWVELEEEGGDPLLLVGLADPGCGISESEETSEEPAVALVGPAHIPRTLPATGPQGIESTVVAHPERGVATDRLVLALAQEAPRSQRTGMIGDDGRHGPAPLVGHQRGDLRQAMTDLGRFGGEHRARWAQWGQVDRLVAHMATLRPRVRDMLALSLETAKTVAVVVAATFVASSALSAVLIKNIVAKILGTAVLAAIAVGVWSQRSNVENCIGAAKVAAAQVASGSGVTCTFFGFEVDVPAP